jgi:HK97 family phage prohead protease
VVGCVLRQPERLSGLSLLKGSSDLVVAGYASVELVDKQGDLITRSALKDAFKKFMTEPKYRNVQLAHSNIQVGEVIPNYTDTEGRMWKSEVDDAGMFVVVQLRNDIEKAREVAAEVRKGNLTGFSIGGQAFKRVNKSDNTHGSYQEISKLELHEITICEKGINPEATFKILKEDKNNNMVNKMTDDVMEQMNSVLERLEGRLDSMEKGEMPPGLKEHMKDKKGDEKKEDKDEAEKAEEKMYGKMKEEKDKDDKEKSEFSDVITAEYLDWMENTLKSAGVDTAEARMHFDNVAKANLGSTPESIGDGADYFAAQVKGRAQEGGNPSTNAIQRAGLSGGGKVEKGDFLTSVDPASAEEAYAVFKAAKQEEELRKALEGNFEARYSEERTAEITKAQAQEFDARGPLGEVMKALDALNERIDNIGSSVESSTIAKADSPSIEVPSTADLANMSWEEVHRLAGGLFTE